MSNKIKVSSLEIIVTEGLDNPYYQIKYYDVVAKSWHIGYSSYDLNCVVKWKEECFEMVGSDYENYCPHCGTDKNPCMGIISKTEKICRMLESIELQCKKLTGELNELKQLSNSKCDVDSIYPLTVIYDRYDGVYSGGKYTAWNLSYYEIPEDVSGDDMDCPEFWGHNDIPCGKGNSPENAILDLYLKLQEDGKIKRSENCTCPNCG